MAGLTGTAATFLSNAQWDVLIDDSTRELHALVIRSNRKNPRDITTDTSTTLTSGTDTYSLPSDLLELMELDRLPNGNADPFFVIQPFQSPRRGDLTTSLFGSHLHGNVDNLYQYRLLGDSIQLLPIPQNSTDVIRFRYIPEATLFSDDSATFISLGNYPLQAERYVALEDDPVLLAKHRLASCLGVHPLERATMSLRCSDLVKAPLRPGSQPPNVGGELFPSRVHDVDVVGVVRDDLRLPELGELTPRDRFNRAAG